MTFPPHLQFRVHLNKRRPLLTWAVGAALCTYLLLCIVAFFTLEQPVNQEHRYRIGADSNTYWGIADLLREGNDGAALVTLSGNLLGPVAVALLLKTEFFVMLLNIALLLIAIYAVGKIAGVDRWLFALLLMLNAETFTSLITLNKEIFALLSASLFAKYVYSSKRSFLLLVAVLLAALFARWEQMMIVLVYLFLVRGKVLVIDKPSRRVLAVILLITFSYPIAAARLDLTGFTVQAANGRTIAVLNFMQAHLLFPLAVLPKILLNVTGQLVTPSYYFNAYLYIDPSDLQNRFAIQLHTVALCALLLVLFLRKRFQLREPLVFFAAVYMVFTAVTPFVQPRYQYPVYVLLALELARNRYATFRASAAAKLVPEQPTRVRFRLRALPARFGLHRAGI